MSTQTNKMGSNQSRLQRKDQVIQPLNLRSNRMHRTFSTYSDDSLKYDVDSSPGFVDDELFITVEPQQLTLVFTVNKLPEVTHFFFDRVIHRARYSSIIEIMSEQVLLPIVHFSRIPVRDGILHMCRDSDVSLRILERQLNKLWFIEDGQISVSGFRPLPSPWSFWITDQNKWTMTGSDFYDKSGSYDSVN